MTYEADSRHAKLTIEEMGLDMNSKGLGAASIRNSGEEVDNIMAEEPLEKRGGHKVSGHCSSSELLGVGSSRHPVRDEGDMQGHVGTQARVLGKVKEASKVFAPIPESDLEV